MVQQDERFEVVASSVSPRTSQRVVVAVIALIALLTIGLANRWDLDLSFP